MLTGIVVAVLGRPGQPLERLELRQGEIASALSHLLVQPLVLPLEVQVEETGRQKIADSQQHLVVVERFGEEILGAAGERSLLCLVREVRRHDEDRQIAVGRNQMAEPLHDLETVDLGHPQIQQQEIGLELGEQTQHLGRIGGARHALVAAAREDLLEELDVGELVVDDQNTCAQERLLFDHETW